MSSEHLERDGSNAAAHRKHLIEVMAIEDEMPIGTVAAVFNMSPEEISALIIVMSDADYDADTEYDEEEDSNREIQCPCGCGLIPCMEE